MSETGPEEMLMKYGTDGTGTSGEWRGPLAIQEREDGKAKREKGRRKEENHCERTKTGMKVVGHQDRTGKQVISVLIPSLLSGHEQVFTPVCSPCYFRLASHANKTPLRIYRCHFTILKSCHLFPRVTSEESSLCVNYSGMVGEV